MVVGSGAPHEVFKPMAEALDAPYISVENQGMTFKEQNEMIAKRVVELVLEKLKIEDRL